MEAPKIYSTIAAVMQKINAISKGRKNQQQGFQYRGIDDVMNELHPIMAECGLFVVPTVESEERTTGQTRNGGAMNYTRLKIKFTFYAADGSNIDAVVIGEAMDSGDKASNKALSVGLKYAMLQVFCIPTEDEKDPDAESPVMAPAPQQPQKPQRAQQNMSRPNRGSSKPQPAGGPDTADQRNEINALLGACYKDNKPIFTEAEINSVPAKRMTETAPQLIEHLKATIAARRNAQPQPAGELAMKAAEVPQTDQQSLDAMGAVF